MILQILDKALINTEQRLDSNERDQYVRPVRRVFHRCIRRRRGGECEDGQFSEARMSKVTPDE